MLDLQSRRARAGGQLVPAAPTAPARRVLCVTGRDQTLPATASVEEAVAFVAGATAVDRSGDPGPGHMTVMIARTGACPDRTSHAQCGLSPLRLVLGSGFRCALPLFAA
jgi:hypothetical protein